MNTMQNNDSYSTLKDQADAIVLVASLLPPVRNLRANGGMVNPYMPEDDAALVRTVSALVERGDHMATCLNAWQENANTLFKKWYDGDGKTLTWDDFEALGVESNGPVYEWQKSRERMAWAAEHRSVESLNAQRATEATDVE